MRKSVRERKTSKFFLDRNFAIGIESESEDVESEYESEELKSEEEPEPFVSPPPSSSVVSQQVPTNGRKRKSEDLTTNISPSPSPNTRRRKISIFKSIRMFGNLEYINKEGLKTSQLFNFQTNGEKGFHFEKSGMNGFSINNFAVGNYIYFFVKKSIHTLYDLLIKITPNEQKIEISNDVLFIYPSNTREYKKSFDRKHPSVNILLTSQKDKHLQLIFRDTSDVPFCTLNIESSE